MHKLTVDVEQTPDAIEKYPGQGAEHVNSSLCGTCTYTNRRSRLFFEKENITAEGLAELQHCARSLVVAAAGDHMPSRPIRSSWSRFNQQSTTSVSFRCTSDT